MNPFYKRFLIIFPLILGACAGTSIKKTKPQGTVRERRMERDGKFFGEITLWDTNRKRDLSEIKAGEELKVNSYLWHGALDALSFMPISSADPLGGTIITDWYSMPGQPKERVKINVFILDRILRSDALRVTVFKEQWDDSVKQWMPLSSSKRTAEELEDIILTKARHLKIRDLRSS